MRTVFQLRSGLIAGLTCVAMLAFVQPASALTVGSVLPSPPSTVMVGDTFNASITLSNLSVGPESTSANVTEIDLYPECAVFLTDCTGGNSFPGAMTVSSVATGSATGGATGCTGAWTVTQTPPGKFRFSPPAAAPNLPTSATCVLSFTVKAERMPTGDLKPAPGTQTLFNANATFSFLPMGPASQRTTGSTEFTVVKDQPSLTTAATPQAAPGQQISDQATLNGTTPTGTIEFKAYGPDDPTCTQPPVYTHGVAVNGNGTYNSGGFTPPGLGTYRWIAIYGGDSNNLAAAGACGDSGEISIVALPIAPPAGTSQTPGSSSLPSLTGQRAAALKKCKKKKKGSVRKKCKKRAKLLPA